jgi:hypothetical protein
VTNTAPAGSLVEREPDAEVRGRLNAVNSKMLAAIEAELEKRMSETE